MKEVGLYVVEPSSIADDDGKDGTEKAADKLRRLIDDAAA